MIWLPYIARLAAALALACAAALLVGRALPGGAVLALTLLTSYRYQTTDIRLLDAAYGRSLNLTHSPGVTEGMPAWSPDGDWLAFVAYIGGAQELYISDVSGRDRRLLHTMEFLDGSIGPPVWSPDGTQLIFAVNHADGTGGIYAVASTGGAPRELTDDDGVFDLVTWSPDGGHIAFEASLEGNSDIYLMDADGANLHNLTDHPAYDGIPTWLPDGRALLFSSTREGGSYGLYLLTVETRAVRRLNDHILLNPPSWSPDGAMLVFDSARERRPGVFALPADCLDCPAHNLTAAVGSSLWPRWSPDGRHIAFLSTYEDGFPRAYALDAACVSSAAPCAPRRLTDSLANLDEPVWRP